MMYHMVICFFIVQEIKKNRKKNQIKKIDKKKRKSK